MKIAARRAGVIMTYIDNDTGGVGWFDDFDGKWVFLTRDSFRTIGNASSGAAIAAAWCQTLFTLFWNRYDNTRCQLLTSGGSNASRGASATADWNANRRITIPDFRGRTIIGGGQGSGLTDRTKGATIGTETHTLTESEMPSHSHIISGGVFAFAPTGVAYPSAGSGATGVQIPYTGGGASHNNMQPSAIEHLIISAGAR